MSRGLRISLVTVALGVGVLGLWNPPGKAHSEASSPVVILFTNDLGGFLESCQCSGPSVVGLPRLVGTLKKLRQEYPEALVLDSGNLGADLPTAEVAAQALAMVPYDAIGVGGADWKLGPAFWRVADQASLPLLVSNRTYAEAAPQSVRPVRVVQRQGLKIALLGFSPSPPDKERPGLDQPEALVRSSAEAPPEQSPQDCLAMVPEDADVVIIMSQLRVQKRPSVSEGVGPAPSPSKDSVIRRRSLGDVAGPDEPRFHGHLSDRWTGPIGHDSRVSFRLRSSRFQVSKVPHYWPRSSGFQGG